MADEFLVVGQVVAAQGLKGEVRILPASDFPQRFTEPGSRWLRRRGHNEQEVQLLSGRQLPGKELFVVRFEGINDRTAAESLVHQEFLVSADDIPELEDGEFHVRDLQGLSVRLETESDPIGVVVDLHHGGNDLLEIELKADGRRCLVPFVDAIVPQVELEEGWLLITPPKGLLDG
jgi:16S rRNA processing protein RimM